MARGEDTRYHPARRPDGTQYVNSPLPERFSYEYGREGGASTINGPMGARMVQNPASRGGDNRYTYRGPGNAEVVEGVSPMNAPDFMASHLGYRFNPTGGRIAGDGPRSGNWSLPKSDLRRGV